MNKIIKINNDNYDRYEQLLIKRDVLRKEAYMYECEYIRTFGKYISDCFEAKILCIEKKKVIAYCQKILNRNGKINGDELDNYIHNVMKDYYDELNSMLEMNDRLNKTSTISEYTYRLIKKVYYRIARLIHPDMNPSLTDDDNISDLWNRTVIAYNTNNLKELEEIEVLVNKYLESIDYDFNKIDIPDISDRIFNLNIEIQNIINNDPYQYKYLLNDEDAIEEYKNELINERKDYERYIEELDEVINSFNIERIYS